MANGLLQQIANPPQVDIAGSIMRGQGMAQNKLLMQGQREKMEEDKRLRALGLTKAQLDSIGLDLVAAGMMQGESQTKMLQQGLEKAPEGSFIRQQLQSGIDMPPGKERDASIFKGISFLQATGNLPEPEKPTAKKGKQKTGAFLVKDPATGEKKVAVGVFDIDKGTLTTETASFGGMDVVSKLGETAEQQTERRIGEARGKVIATGQEKKAATLIDRGVAAAESTAQLKRGLELLEKVKTGGVNALSFAVKAKLGIEGADAGELSRSLGVAVLSQLRETFGAAFTEQEGKRLERLEAGLGKSQESNKRILTQVLKTQNQLAGRARLAAKRRGDMETVADIDELLKFTLSTESQVPEPQPGAGQQEQGGAQQTQINEPYIINQQGVKQVVRNGKWVNL